MTDLTGLIERLSALDEKRTPGEWGTISASTGITWAEDESGRAIFDCYCLTSHQEPRPFDNADANAAFITTLANEALPALKAQQAEIERLREALKKVCQFVVPGKRGVPGIPWDGWSLEQYEKYTSGFNDYREKVHHIVRPALEESPHLARQALGEE